MLNSTSCGYSDSLFSNSTLLQYTSLLTLMWLVQSELMMDSNRTYHADTREVLISPWIAWKLTNSLQNLYIYAPNSCPCNQPARLAPCHKYHVICQPMVNTHHAVNHIILYHVIRQATNQAPCSQPYVPCHQAGQLHTTNQDHAVNHMYHVISYTLLTRTMQSTYHQAGTTNQVPCKNILANLLVLSWESNAKE